MRKTSSRVRRPAFEIQVGAEVVVPGLIVESRTARNITVRTIDVVVTRAQNINVFSVNTFSGITANSLFHSSLLD